MKFFGAHLITGLVLLLVNNILYAGAILCLVLYIPYVVNLYWFAAGFLYASLIEYGMHRYLLHAGIALPAKLHGAHHAHFRCASMLYHHQSEWHLILFSPLTTVLILLVSLMHLPVFFILHVPDVGYAIALSVAVYFFLYEWLHLAAHAPQAGLRHFRVLRLLRHYHFLHHSRHSGNRNFNVVLPFADLLFRSRATDLQRLQ